MEETISLMQRFEEATIPKGDWINFFQTFGIILLLGAAFGLLAFWAFEHDNKED